MFWMMPTGSLFFLKKFITGFTLMAVWPLEHFYDRIDDELEARGHRVGLGDLID
jgi:hypothetical protein